MITKEVLRSGSHNILVEGVEGDAQNIIENAIKEFVQKNDDEVFFKAPTVGKVSVKTGKKNVLSVKFNNVVGLSGKEATLTSANIQAIEDDKGIRVVGLGEKIDVLKDYQALAKEYNFEMANVNFISPAQLSFEDMDSSSFYQRNTLTAIGQIMATIILGDQDDLMDGMVESAEGDIELDKTYHEDDFLDEYYTFIKEGEGFNHFFENLIGWKDYSESNGVTEDDVFSDMIDKVEPEFVDNIGDHIASEMSSGRMGVASFIMGEMEGEFSDEVKSLITLLTPDGVKDFASRLDTYIDSNNPERYILDYTMSQAVFYIDGDELDEIFRDNADSGLSFVDWEEAKTILEGLTSDQETVVTDLAKETDHSIGDISNIIADAGIEGRGIQVEFGSEEYVAFEDLDDAESEAIARVREDWENEGTALFNESFWKYYVDEEKLMSELDSDLRNGVYESPDSYTNFIDNEEPEDEETGEYSEDQIERMADAYIEEISRDPLEFLQRDLGYEGKALSDFLVPYVEEKELAEGAVRDDGIAHFLSTYDGNEIDLDSGGVAFREN